MVTSMAGYGRAPLLLLLWPSGAPPWETPGAAYAAGAAHLRHRFEINVSSVQWTAITACSAQSVPGVPYVGWIWTHTLNLSPLLL